MRKLIFVHQPKTGGTTLVEALKRQLGEEHVFYDSDGPERKSKPMLYRWVDTRVQNWRMYEDRRDYQLIYGHFEPLKYRKAFPEALYLTFFRDPIQRFVSLYYYWLRAPLRSHDNPKKRFLVEQQLDLKAFAKFFLSPRRDKKRTPKYALKYFDFIGITEAYSASVELFRRKHMPDLAFDVQAERVNPTKAMYIKYELDDETYAYIARLLAQQLKLYKEAVTHFNAECLRAQISLSSALDHV